MELQESTITKCWETSREIFNVSGTGNVGATATLTEPRHKGSKDTAAGRQWHKTPPRKHVSVSERGSNNSSISPQTSDQQNLARATPYSTDRLPESASNSRREVALIQINTMSL